MNQKYESCSAERETPHPRIQPLDTRSIHSRGSHAVVVITFTLVCSSIHCHFRHRITGTTSKMRVSSVTAAVAAVAVRAAVPSWPPTWDMQASTIIQPCNNSGFLEPISFYAQYGIVDIGERARLASVRGRMARSARRTICHLAHRDRRPDWSNAKSLWVVPPMRDEEMLLEQCARLKAVNPALRCFVYRNLVKVTLQN